MKLRVLNGLLAAAICFGAFLVWNLDSDPTEPNVQFIPEMHYSIPYNPQSANPLTADGKTLQFPPPGTIARGYLPMPYGPSEADRSKAGRELVNPAHPDSNEAQERGSLVYLRYCQPCHGSTGAGNGVVTLYGFPPPPSFAAPNILSLRDGEIFHAITYGKGNMPSLASQVDRSDRWNVILKVHELQQNLLRHQQPVAQSSAGQNQGK